MYVCICHKVTDTAIRNAVQSGADTLDALCRDLKVASCCGRCEDCARRVLRQAKAEQCSCTGFAIAAT